MKLLFLFACCFLSDAAEAQLLFEQNFNDGQTHCADNSAIECQCHEKGCCDCTEKIKAVESPDGKEGMSCRHRLWNCGERAELQYKGNVQGHIGDERWYSWEVYFDEDYFEDGGGSGLICQFPAYPTKRDFRKGCRGVGTDIRTTNSKQVVLYFQRPGEERISIARMIS